MSAELTAVTVEVPPSAPEEPLTGAAEDSTRMAEGEPPTLAQKKKKAASEEETQTEKKQKADICAICLAEMPSSRAGTVLLGCDHRFHENCLVQWCATPPPSSGWQCPAGAA